MARILLTHSYFMRLDPKQWATGQPYAPLGTLYAAAVLREAGHEVSIVDTMFAESPTVLEPSLQTGTPAYLVIYDDGFNYLTKMCLTNMREAAFNMIALAKAKGCKVIVSSSDSTDQFDAYLDKGADYILLGEAEQTLSELIATIEQKKDLMQVAGIAYRHQDATIRTAKRALLKDLDSLPFPAWDLINMEPYRKSWLKKKGYFSINMATTRGCPFKCNWCAKPIYGNRYNSRSPQHVINELKMLKQNLQFDHVWFCDDIFGLKPGWVKEFADLVEKEQLKFTFKIQARVDLMSQENYIRDLARAGCTNCWMGAESGAQKILDAMDKGTTVEQIYSSSKLLKKHGINPSFFIQFGYPGETRKDIEKTIAMINELLPYEIGISVSYPLPGTIFYERVKMQLQDKTNWTDSDELALMFRNTYQPAFYKQLHRYVHRSYRKHLAIAQVRTLLSKPASTNMRRLKKAISLFYYTPMTWLAGRKLQRLENINV